MWALVGMAFFAVLREGFETSVFLLAAFNDATDTTAAGLGVVLGLAAAIALGYGIYRGGVHLDLARFFRATGVVLVIVAAGLVAVGAAQRGRGRLGDRRPGAGAGPRRDRPPGHGVGVAHHRHPRHPGAADRASRSPAG